MIEKKLSALNAIERTSLFNRLRVSFTHHSSAIEGISLTYGETKKLLEEGITAENKPLHEQLIVLGFAEAFDYVILEAIKDSNNIDLNIIKNIHSILFDKAMRISPERVERPVGAWRTDERHIKGINIQLSPPNLIEQAMGNLLYKYPSNMGIYDIANFHIEFEKIHPFSDGNGRVGRLIIVYQAIQNDYIPPLILNDNRKEYLDSLFEAKHLEHFLIKSINNSIDLISKSS